MKTTTTRPFVLHVDDEPDDLRTWQEEIQRQGLLDLEVCHPQEIAEASLRNASLVLVDFRIRHWPERANASALALRPPNGLAVLTTLQETADELDATRARAYALYTAAIQDVARELVHQPHIVARAHNLDWVFEKNRAEDPIEGRAGRVAALAEAVAALPKDWPGEESSTATAALHAWLGLRQDVSWSDAAARAVRRRRPPIHEFAEHTLGMGVVRWALTRYFRTRPFSSMMPTCSLGFEYPFRRSGQRRTQMTSRSYSARLGTRANWAVRRAPMVACRRRTSDLRGRTG